MKLERSAAVNLLVAALAVGTGVLVFSTGGEPTTSELSAREKNLLPSFSRERFRALSVRSARGEFTVEAAGKDSDGEAHFTVRGGRGDAVHEADPEAVEALLRSLELAGFIRRLEAAEGDRAALGVEKPVGALTLDIGGSSLELRIGKEALTPAETTYVEVRGPGGSGGVFLVRTDFVRDVLVERDSLRKKGLLAYGLSEIERIRWKDAGATLELRRGQGAEFLDSKGKRVKRATLERLALELSRVKSERFVESIAARSALEADPSALSVEIEPMKGDALAFRTGGACPKEPSLRVLLRSKPAESAECVSPEVSRVLREAAANLRDDTPFSLRTDEVESVRIDRAGKTLELVRDESAFKMLAPAPGAVDLDAGNGRLDALVRLEGEIVDDPDLGSLGLRLPSGTVKLRSSAVGSGDRYEETVELGAVMPDGRLPVRRARDGVVLLLGQSAREAYTVDTSLLKSRRLLDFGPSQLLALSIRAGGERQRLKRTGDGFELVEPAGHRHDGALVLDLVQALGTLTADRWVADAPEPRHGLSEPTAVLELELGGSGKETRRVVLTVGGSAPGGSYATLDTQPGVFVLPRGFVLQATTPLLSRAAFEVDPGQLSSVVIERAKGALTLKRSGDALLPTGSNLSPAAIERLTEALANLRPEAALHGGPARAGEGFDAPTLSIRFVLPDRDSKPRVLRIGSTSTYRGAPVYNARIDGIDATYVIPQSAVRAVLENVE